MFTADQYKEQLLKLMPKGHAWSRDADGVLHQVAEGIAQECARIDGRIDDGRNERLTPDELLPEYEEQYGLPNPCAQAATTDDDRRAGVLAAEVGGAAEGDDYWIQLADQFGYTATVARPAPYEFEIYITGTPVQVFRAGGSTAGDPLRVLGDEARFECFALDVAHQHVQVTVFWDTYRGAVTRPGWN